MKRLGVGPTLLLGVIIERVSGQPLGTFLRERILTPCSFARSPTAAKKFPAEHAPTAGPVRVRARELAFLRLGASRYLVDIGRSGPVGRQLPDRGCRGIGAADAGLRRSQVSGIESSPYPGARYGAVMFILPDNRLVKGLFRGLSIEFHCLPGPPIRGSRTLQSLREHAGHPDRSPRVRPGIPIRTFVVGSPTD
jgi:CubicO group peptidase (beta-lactamase class C family)